MSCEAEVLGHAKWGYRITVVNRGVFRLIFAPNRARIPFIEDPFNGLVTSNTTLRFVSGLAGNLGRPGKFMG
jgi:hypothetical protein